MKLDFTKLLWNRSNGPVVMAGTNTQMTVLDAAWLALDHALPSTFHEEKYQRYQLSKKLEKSNWDLTAEEIALLKKAIGEYTFISFLHGWLIDFLEAKETPKLESIK